MDLAIYYFVAGVGVNFGVFISKERGLYPSDVPIFYRVAIVLILFFVLARSSWVFTNDGSNLWKTSGIGWRWAALLVYFGPFIFTWYFFP